MAQISLSTLRDYWKNISDWVTGISVNRPKVDAILTGSLLEEQKTEIDVTSGVYEVASLDISSNPTVAGDVTVTLDGISTNIAVVLGTAEEASLDITAIPTTAGNVTITLDGVATTVAVDPATDTTTDAVATKIRNTTFTGWTTGGTASNVTFTANSVGIKADALFDAGTTGATGTMTTTVQGVDADTSTSVATKIRSTVFNGWATSGSGTNVTFTATTYGDKTDATFSAGSTGVTGTMSTVTQGNAILSFGENIVAIEMFNRDVNNDGTFVVNGISIIVPKSDVFKASIGGTPGTDVTISGSKSYIVSRYV